MTALVALLPTEQKQRRASDPTASAFVAANAGSGKTYVLVKRILRLLLNKVDPAQILALTYTTAAAANMSNRVFKELSDWVSLDDNALANELFKLDGNKVNAERLILARQLFACAVETPGGLKIQTIHAFCERVLHLFPFEANVPARFEVLDDRMKAEFLSVAYQSVIDRRHIIDDPMLATAVDELIKQTGEHGFETILGNALGHSEQIKRHGRDQTSIDGFINALKIELNLKLDKSATQIEDEIYQGRITDLDCKEIGEILISSSPKDQDIGLALLGSLNLSFGEDWKQIYFSAFLTAKSEPRSDKNYVTKTIREKFSNIHPVLAAERDRIVALLEIAKAADAVSRTRALMSVASRIVKIYEKQKVLSGTLDFDDLIERTCDLLKRAGAQWVLYKLDRGIDHVLIDEAQDTSPKQWEILKLLTAEFHVGEGARSTARSVFAVGDPKQSIYSFQGAEPAAFSDNRDIFKHRIASLEHPAFNKTQAFHDEKLTLSFRSAPDILMAVDAVFGLPAHYQGLDRDAQPTVHESQRQGSPGLVEIWQALTVEETELSDNWSAPLDEPSKGSPPVLLARQIADHIAQLVKFGSPERIEVKPGFFRPITPGDILILVRKRGVFFETVIRALKDRSLPVAGADRLKLSEHIAVMDLVALGQAILTPEDDLTLACVLKSPLIGLDEEQLMQLSAERSGSLIEEINSNVSNSIFIAAKAKLFALQEAANCHGPFGFYSFVLGPYGGRRSFKSRLGAEADDALDEFLRLALEHEQRETPSLTLFIEKFLASDLTVKRDMDAGRNEVRVMTVHGAKGLEAPVVYLPDTCGAAVDKKKLDPIFNIGASKGTYIPVWSPSQSTDSLVIAKLREDAVRLQAEEHRRLLYVAMTRPRDRLYIAGYVGKRKLPDDCWYSMIDTALGPLLTEFEDKISPLGSRRLQTHAFPQALPSAVVDNAPNAAPAPDWLRSAPIEELLSQPPLRPSSAIVAADRNERPIESSFSRVARRRGILVHSLLQILPSIPMERRMAIAMNYLRVNASDMDGSAHLEMASEVLKVIVDSDISPIFAQNSRAEVPLAGLLRRDGYPPRQVSGQIDRLAVLENEVLITDFKTTSAAPKGPEGVPMRTVAQLATYRALIGDLYPDRKIRCFVIYTAAIEVFELADEVLSASLSIIE
jgi:ATP-dependent helicase/nuclease subunit A